MDILFFIIFPIATILIAIVLQKLLKSPILVAIFVFAVFLILAYTAFSTDFLLNAIIYTIIAFIVAASFKLICCLRRRINCNIFSVCNDSDNCSCNNNDDKNNFETSIANIEDSIDTINDNINRLTRLLSSAINNGNNNCCCNRRLRR